mgnify:CR=1 FL=1
MTYNFVLANDNGNSEHKIMINGNLYRQPNVYAVLHSDPGESDELLEAIVSNLHNHIDIRIESKAITGNYRYLIGNAALQSVSQADLYNMDVKNIKKQHEDLPVINTLGIIVAEAVKNHYKKNSGLENGETIQVDVDMTTALPASIHDSENEKVFHDRFVNNLHEVKVYIKNLVINVQVAFKFVKVMKEGVPALFALIEDGKEHYRKDEIFDQFNKDYNKDVDGSYFLDKRLLHMDIGDGSTELVYTKGYSADPYKSTGEKFGLGQAIEKASVNLSKELDIDITRQKISEYLKDSNHRFHKLALKHMVQPKKEVADKLFTSIVNRLKALAYEVDVIPVYGGASILLNDVMYNRLKEYCKDYGIEVLWVPSQFAVDMNVNGMNIFNSIKLKELTKEQVKA